MNHHNITISFIRSDMCETVTKTSKIEDNFGPIQHDQIF
jgi:hypothetical protein